MNEIKKFRFIRKVEIVVNTDNDEIIGKTMFEIAPPCGETYQSTTGDMIKIDEKFFNYSKKIIEKLFEEGKVTSWESYFLHKNGRVIPVERSLVYLDAKDGGDGGAVGIGKDITGNDYGVAKSLIHLPIR